MLHARPISLWAQWRPGVYSGDFRKPLVNWSNYILWFPKCKNIPLKRSRPTTQAAKKTTKQIGGLFGTQTIFYFRCAQVCQIWRKCGKPTLYQSFKSYKKVKKLWKLRRLMITDDELQGKYQKWEETHLKNHVLSSQLIDVCRMPVLIADNTPYCERAFNHTTAQTSSPTLQTLLTKSDFLNIIYGRMHTPWCSHARNHIAWWALTCANGH